MTILNGHNIYYLSDIHGPKSKVVRYDYDPLLWPYFHHDVYKEYCIIEFFQGYEFADHNLSDIIDLAHIEKIMRREAYLVLHNSHEAFHWVVKPIYQHLIIPYQLPPEQIILLSESPDIKSVIETVSREFDLDQIQAKWINKFQYDIHRDNNYLCSLGKQRTPLTYRNYERKFINLNRRWRDHRPCLVAAFWHRNLLDKGYVSLAKSDDDKNWQNIIPHLQEKLSGNEYFSKLFIENKKELELLPELTIDNVDLTKNQPELTTSLDYYYENAYFSVVSETVFFTNGDGDYGRFMSEKTFKPMANLHPFIIVTVPNFLDKLKDIGYKTFDPFIDESYDKEKDNGLRLEKIVNEVERLCNLSSKELQQFIDNVNPICQHNYNLLMNRSNFIFDI